MVMVVFELTTYTPSDLDFLDALLHELSPTSFCSKEKLDAVVNDANSHLYVIREEDCVVATATLCISHTPEFILGAVETVVVSTACRGKGYGRLLMEHILKEANRLGCEKLHLTSNPRRVIANSLYQAFGFRKYDTNYYELEIK